MVTGIVEVTQDPEKAGSALKVLSLRLRGMKGQLEELGEETDENVENISKMQGQILNMTKGKVNIFDGAGNFKSTYEIMKGIAEVWDDLSSIDQANLLETIAGKNRANDVAALLSNWENVEAAVKSASEAEGSAARENAKYVDSIQGRLDKMTTSWQSFANTFMSSDFLKGAISALTKFIEGLEKVVDTVGAFPTLMGTIAAGFSLFKNGGIFKTLTSDLDGFINKIGIANRSFADLANAFNFGKTSGGLKGGLSAIKNSLSGGLTKADIANIQAYNEEIRSGTSAQTAWYRTMQTSSKSAQDLVASAKGSEVALNGMKTATIGSKVALIGAKVAAVAFNAALTMGISLLIDWAVSGIQKLINAKKDLAEKVEEITSKFKEQHDELLKLKGDYDTSNESSMISKYEKLSQGVDNLGRNVSLTADEYSEYQSIVNTIADQIPSLVSGYDSQGNALLSCKGNVEALTEAYEKLIHAQNQEILTNTGDIEKDFANTVKDANGNTLWGKYREWSTNSSLWKKFLVNLNPFGAFINGTDAVADLTSGNKMTADTAKALKDLLNADRNNVGDIIADYDDQTLQEIETALKDAGVDVGFLGGKTAKALEETLKNEPAKIKGIVDDFYGDLEETIEQQKLIGTAKLSEAFDISNAISGLNYGNISEDLQAIAYQVVNSFDYDFLSKLSESGKSVEQWVTEMLDSLNSLSEADNKKIETGFELQTKFNGGDISYGQYISQLQKTVDFIDKDLKVPDEVKNQIKLSLNSEDILADYNALVHDLKNIGFDDTSINKFLNSLSAEEFSAAMKIIPSLDAGTTIAKIQKLIDEQLATEFKFDIAIQAEGIEAFNAALAESRSAAGLTSESIGALKARYEDLDGFNAAALFEKTANGIHLNSEELSRLEEQYINTNKLDIEKNLNKLVTKYNDLTEKIKGCTDAQEQEKENLQLQADAYKDKIDELSTLASQDDGLTSAFAKWQTALEGSEEGDNYDSLYENLEGIKELYDKGLVGTDKFKTAAQLMTNKDLANADIDEIVSAYKKGYPKMQRYFTEGQKGCKNFLNDVRNLNSEWAHMNKDGSWEINFNAEEVAKELGISVDFVLQIAKKLKDYGFEVNLEDSSVDNLKTKIEQTEAKLKELGQSPVDINVDIEANSANLSKIDSEIEKAKNKIKEINSSSVDPKVKTAQLEDAQAKLEALVDKKIEASQPAFMNLNTSQVNASLVDALEKIQDYQNAINEVNKLTELKEAGITIDDSQIKTAKEKVDECAKAIQGLDGDVKVAIGLEEDGSIDSIKKSFEDGKVKIDADTDPAFTKIEQLAENVERIEDKDVTINVTVNGLDDVKELNENIEKLNKSINLDSDIEGNVDKLTKYVEGAKTLSELDDNIASFVTAEVKGNVLEKSKKELKRLGEFAEHAKTLQSANSKRVDIDANVNGNVISTKERNIDNLKTFIESSKGIKDIEGNIVSNITANTLGSVFEDRERNIDNLDVFIESAKGIKDIEGNIVSNITANTLGSVFEDRERNIDNLDVFIESAKGIKDIEGDITSNITANTLGSVFEDRERNIDNLETFIDSAKGIKEIQGDIVSNITANTLGSVFEDTERTIDNLDVFVESAKGIKDIQGDIVSNITANTLGSVFEDKERTIDNLDVFIESAKGIKEIQGDIVSNITANTLGSVFEDKERVIDNLDVFVDSAKGIKEIQGDIVSNITANVDGNVVGDKTEAKINNLEVFADGAKELQGIGSKTVDITANIYGNVPDKTEGYLDDLQVFAKGAKDLQNVASKTVEVTANIYGNVPTYSEGYLDDLQVFAKGANALQNTASKTVNIEANANGNVISGEGASGRLTSLTEFKSLVEGMSNQAVSVSVTANVDSEKINSAIDLLSRVANSGVFKDYSATVQVGATIATIDDTTVQNYKAPSKDGKVKYSVDPESSVYTWTAPSKDGVVNYSASVDALTDAQKHKTGTITYKAKISGFPVVNGTANVNGTAFAHGTDGRAFRQGDWGAKRTETALTGELGQELVVYKNRYWTVGDNGAEFATIPRGAIVFNHKQTEELLKNGRVTSDGGRGRALVEGTAYENVTGRGTFYNPVTGRGTFYNPVTGESYGSKDSDSSDKDFEEVIDWIETIIDRVERAIDKFDQQANNIYKSWSSRNKALQNQISEVSKEISIQQQAYNKYMSAANGVGLDESWASKVRNGEIDIETIKDETLKEKIDDYQNWYEKALDCKDAIEELKETEASLYAQRLENVATQYEGILGVIEHEKNMLEEYISQSEAQGHLVSGEYYKALVNNEQETLSELENQKAAMLEELNAAMESGTITEGSEAW